jgi:hypothetical protein
LAPILGEGTYGDLGGDLAVGPALFWSIIAATTLGDGMVGFVRVAT